MTCLGMTRLAFSLQPRSCMVSQRLKRHSKSNRSPVSILAGQSVHSRVPSQSGRVMAARVRISCTARKIFFLVISVMPVSRPCSCNDGGKARYSDRVQGELPIAWGGCSYHNSRLPTIMKRNTRTARMSSPQSTWLAV